jgi:1-acyl-sn-glycerol-3-phosphate acyltransferase
MFSLLLKPRLLALANRILSKNELEKFKNLKFKDLGFGYDKFGFNLETCIISYSFAKLLYKYYFRVDSVGVENIPSENSAIIASNHSGVIPVDAAMIACDIFSKTNPPRVLRSVVDFFAFYFPFIGVFLSRTGQVVGTRRNFEELINDKELIGVFPEGTNGIGKSFRERYKLKKFNVGHIELSIKYKIPIIPTAVIGAEEQAPILYNVQKIAKFFKLPYFPITPTFPILGPLGILPFPTKYRIYYGDKIEFYKNYETSILKETKKVEELAKLVRNKVQNLINKGLIERKGVFV